MLLDFIAYFFIPAYTLLFAGPSQWMTTNFSALGNQVERRLAFALWGLMIGLYFSHCLRQLIPKMGGGRWAWRGREVSLLLLFFAITTPYLPQQMPLKAFLHVMFSFSSAITLLVTLFALLLRHHRLHPEQTHPYLMATIVIALLSLLILLLGGMVSTALELFLTLSLTILLRKMLLVAWH